MSLKKKALIAEASSKSERGALDASAPMGVATHHIEARLAASVGALGAVLPQFEPALDVPHGGVLCALPALLAMGLLEGAEKYLTFQDGYYALDSLLILLAFMALCRMETVEELRRHAPGEWGRLLGLDRAPEVRTLRGKIHEISQDGNPKEWSASLCQRWMENAPGQAGVLYIDGHVRVYHGDQTALPKHYVAREKLCLRATVDYWVNAMDGQPFMVFNQVVDHGLIKAIEEDILPSLESLHPAFKDPAPKTHRLTLIFDREGYSPDFFRRMRDQKIACVTYRKNVTDAWPEEEFSAQQVPLVSGQIVTQKLAERGVPLSNKLWVREIRKLTERGHQTAIIATDYHTIAPMLAGQMFARWSQENFFRYARENFGLDRLADYSTEEITDPIRVVNPAYRRLDSQVRSANGKLSRLHAKWGAKNIEKTIDSEQMALFIDEKSALQEQIEEIKGELIKLKAERKETQRHIKVQELPESERFNKLGSMSKHFIDTIKIVAYRAETALANIVRGFLPKPDQARATLCALYASEADILPDYQNNTLTVRLHHSARNHTDAVITKLCDELSATETLFPRTSLRMIFKLGVGSSQNR